MRACGLVRIANSLSLSISLSRVQPGSYKLSSTARSTSDSRGGAPGADACTTAVGSSCAAASVVVPAASSRTPWAVTKSSALCSSAHRVKWATAHACEAECTCTRSRRTEEAGGDACVYVCVYVWVDVCVRGGHVRVRLGEALLDDGVDGADGLAHSKARLQDAAVGKPYANARDR
jgi:cellulose synthase/poly-beta-1,6-N-acetylglucosamine synthase-like glycosyltransferase